MTKKNTLLLAILATLALSAPAFAAEQPLTFGVIDMSKVMQTTDAAKNIFSQLEERHKEYQANISKEEDSLRSAEQEIIKQKSALSKEDFEKKRGEFEKKVISGQKLVQDRKHTLDQAFNTSMSSLRAEAAKIVSEVAKERNFSAILTQDAVLISAPDLDITETVIERLNKNVKKISVDWSAAGASSGKKKK